MPESLNVADARSLLFVPGNRPDRFDKALSSGADGVILDLEDAVGEHAKVEARGYVRDWIAPNRVGAVVRVNAVGTRWHEDDVSTIADQPDVTVMLPKASVAALTALVRRLPAGAQVIPLVETAAGVSDAPAIARVAGVTRLAFGNVDLSAEIGVDSQDHLALGSARSALVFASAAAGLAAPIDGVTTAVRDDATLNRDTLHSRSLGFTGKLCIHPTQVAGVHRAFAPTEAEREHARRVVNAAGDGDVTVLDGAMIDHPVVERARRLLRMAARHPGRT